MSRIVIALGGNALGDNAAEQREKIREACPSLIGLMRLSSVMETVRRLG